MEALSKFKCKDPRVIAKSMEKFIGFSIGNLQFMDSLQHLSASLDKLVTNLAAKTKVVGCDYCPRRGSSNDIERHIKISQKKEFNKPYKQTVKTSTLEQCFPFKQSGNISLIKKKHSRCLIEKESTLDKEEDF